MLKLHNSVACSFWCVKQFCWNNCFHVLRQNCDCDLLGIWFSTTLDKRWQVGFSLIDKKLIVNNMKEKLTNQEIKPHICVLFLCVNRSTGSFVLMEWMWFQCQNCNLWLWHMNQSNPKLMEYNSHLSFVLFSRINIFVFVYNIVHNSREQTNYIVFVSCYYGITV